MDVFSCQPAARGPWHRRRRHPFLRQGARRVRRDDHLCLEYSRADPDNRNGNLFLLASSWRRRERHALDRRIDRHFARRASRVGNRAAAGRETACGFWMIEIDVALKVGTFNLDVAFQNDGGITALFGHSGSGKSLTLNLIAGLMRPDRGTITLDGRILADMERGVFVAPHRRRIGVVFQDSHLFPHLTVRQNLRFGRWFAPPRERAVDFDAVVETLAIANLLPRHPANLSGGERQRVAIGRALLCGPKLLLFDEPLAALDMERKLEILPLIERLRSEFAVPIVYVSHAIEEVARLANLVVVLDAGRVKAIGGPGEVFGPLGGDSGRSRFDRVSVLTMKISGANTAYG